MSGPAPSVTTPSISAHTRIAVIVSDYHAQVTDRLLQGALRAHRESTGLSEAQVRRHTRVVRVPGAWELVHASVAAMVGGYQGIVALGCIVKGETSHDRLLADAVTSGLMRIVTDFGVPIGLGVLTVDTIEQAHARSGGSDGNKGADAMRAVLASIAVAAALAPDWPATALSGQNVSSRPAKPARPARRQSSRSSRKERT